MISPILANIYLNEFDTFMEEICKEKVVRKVKKGATQYIEDLAGKDGKLKIKEITKQQMKF